LNTSRHCEEQSDEAIQSFFIAVWIASWSLSSGAHSRDPVAPTHWLAMTAISLGSAAILHL
jgi:hypothetical protein